MEQSNLDNIEHKSIFTDLGTPPEGFVYFLGRESLRVKEITESPFGDCVAIREERDDTRMHDLKQRGWTVVPADRHPELSEYHKDGAIRSGGLILLERSKVIDEAEKKEYELMNSGIFKALYDKAGLQEVLPVEIPMCGPVHSKEFKEHMNRVSSLGLMKKTKNVKVKKSKILMLKNKLISHYRRLIYKLLVALEKFKFHMNIGQYCLSEKEKEVCDILDISKNSYKKEKYKQKMWEYD
jgi:hypothetical protein